MATEHALIWCPSFCYALEKEKHFNKILNNIYFLWTIPIFFSEMNKIFVLVSFFLVTYAYVNILHIAEGVQQSARQNSLYLQHEF